MEKLKAFHGDKKIKAKYLARVKAHYEADEIISGKYWENGKGCAVGCTVEANSNAHDRYPKDEKKKDLLGRILKLYEKSLTVEITQGEWKKLADEVYSASASASPEWNKIFNARILAMKNKLLKLLKEAK